MKKSELLRRIERLEALHPELRPLPLSDDDLETLLLLAGYRIHDVAAFMRWTSEEREQVATWATLAHLAASDNPVIVPPFPTCAADVLRPDNSEDIKINTPIGKETAPKFKEGQCVRVTGSAKEISAYFVSKEYAGQVGKVTEIDDDGDVYVDFDDGIGSWTFDLAHLAPLPDSEPEEKFSPGDRVKLKGYHREGRIEGDNTDHPDLVQVLWDGEESPLYCKVENLECIPTEETPAERWTHEALETLAQETDQTLWGGDSIDLPDLGLYNLTPRDACHVLIGYKAGKEKDNG